MNDTITATSGGEVLLEIPHFAGSNPAARTILRSLGEEVLFPKGSERGWQAN
jgi:hypothetical protein